VAETQSVARQGKRDQGKKNSRLQFHFRVGSSGKIKHSKLNIQNY
jgi:hypothetical protein